MGLRKKFAVVVAVVVLGAGSVSANMPVIDISSIMTSIQQFVTDVGHMKQEVMKWTNEAKKALKAAQAITKGDFRSFVQGMQQMNALVVKYGNLSDGMRDVLADEDATGAGLVSLFDKYESIMADGGIKAKAKKWSDDFMKKWNGIKEKTTAAWDRYWDEGKFSGNPGEGLRMSLYDFSTLLDEASDFVPLTADAIDDVLGSAAGAVEDFLDPVFHQYNAVARLSNKLDSKETVEKRKERIKKLCEEVSTLTEEIGVALSNGADTEVAQKREQRDQKLKEIEKLKGMHESSESFTRGVKTKIKESKTELDADMLERAERANDQAAELQVLQTYLALGGVVANLPGSKRPGLAATPGESCLKVERL